MISKFRFTWSLSKVLFILLFIVNHTVQSQGFEGYYQYPDVHGNTLVFSAEGDIWTVPLSGGLAQK